MSFRASGVTFFFFNYTATTEIYTLSLHDALPISGDLVDHRDRRRQAAAEAQPGEEAQDPEHRLVRGEGAQRGEDRERSDRAEDRKSTRLNSSHANISYAVFCLKKKINSRS